MTEKVKGACSRVSMMTTGFGIGNTAAERRGIKILDAGNPGPARAEGLPALLGANAERAHQTDSRHYYSARQRWFQARLLFLLVLDVIDGVFHGGDLLGVFIGDVDIESLFERHHQLHDIQRVRTKIIHEGGRIIYLTFVHPQLLDDDLLHSLFNRHESSQTVCKLIDSSDDGHWPQLHPVSQPRMAFQFSTFRLVRIRWCAPDSSS